jgi:hypothetical protein
VAALLLETQPALSPAAVAGALESTAVDMGPPGFDFDTGFGFIQADAALRAIAGPGLSLELTLDRHTAAPGDPVQATLTVTNPGPALVQDFYFVVLVPPELAPSLGCPSGAAVVFAAGATDNLEVRCPATDSPQAYPKLAGGVTIPASLPATAVPGFLDLAWPPGLPEGTYTFAVFTTAPGAFGDGIVGLADVVVSAQDQLEASP